MENKKKTKGFVETPQIIVDIMHFYLYLKENDKLADFTAGRGQLFKNHNSKNCYGIELDEVNFSFLEKKGFENIIFGDFFENIEKMPEVDALILNPPYIKTSNEIIFKSLQKLKNGGRFAIISKDTSFKNFGNEYPEFCKDLNIEMAWKLDLNLFKPFASVKTLLLFGKKGENQGKFEIQEFTNDEIIVNTRAKIIEPKIKHPKTTINGNGNFWEKLNEEKKVDIKPTYDDFYKTVTDYMAYDTGFPVELLRNPKKFGESWRKLLNYHKKD